MGLLDRFKKVFGQHQTRNIHDFLVNEMDLILTTSSFVKDALKAIVIFSTK